MALISRLSLVAGKKLHPGFKTANTAAEAAVAAAPDVPAHAVWRASAHVRARRYRMALSDLRTGIAAGIENPRIHQRRAEILALLKNEPARKAALDDAIAAAPREVPLRMARAVWLHGDGQPQAALADLDVLLNFDAPLPKAAKLHATCLAELGAEERRKHA